MSNPLSSQPPPSPNQQANNAPPAWLMFPGWEEFQRQREILYRDWQQRQANAPQPSSPLARQQGGVGRATLSTRPREPLENGSISVSHTPNSQLNGGSRSLPGRMVLTGRNGERLHIRYGEDDEELRSAVINWWIASNRETYQQQPQSQIQEQQQQQRQPHPPHQQTLSQQEEYCVVCTNLTPTIELALSSTMEPWCQTCLIHRLTDLLAIADNPLDSWDIDSNKSYYNTIAHLLPPDFAARIRARQAECAVSPKDRLYCHVPTCSAWVPPDRAGVCTACAAVTCVLGCMGAAHGEAPCGTEAEEWRREVLELGVKMGWKECPRCGHLVERVSGCTHIACRCGAQFCYVCGKEDCTCREPDLDALLDPNQLPDYLNPFSPTHYIESIGLTAGARAWAATPLQPRQQNTTMFAAGRPQQDPTPPWQQRTRALPAEQPQLAREQRGASFAGDVSFVRGEGVPQSQGGQYTQTANFDSGGDDDDSTSTVPLPQSRNSEQLVFGQSAIPMGGSNSNRGSRSSAVAAGWPTMREEIQASFEEPAYGHRGADIEQSINLGRVHRELLPGLRDFHRLIGTPLPSSPVNNAVLSSSNNHNTAEPFAMRNARWEVYRWDVGLLRFEGGQIRR
ncbi:unnamed protein product [Discula destructiva]